MGQQKLRPSQGRTRPCSCLISIIAQFHEYGCYVGSLMKRNRNGFKILLKERSCSLSNYTKGALLYRGIPICVLCETERPGHQNVRGVLRHYVPSKGLHSPCASKAAIHIRQKARPLSSRLLLLLLSYKHPAKGTGFVIQSLPCRGLLPLLSVGRAGSPG